MFKIRPCYLARNEKSQRIRIDFIEFIDGVSQKNETIIIFFFLIFAQLDHLTSSSLKRKRKIFQLNVTDTSIDNGYVMLSLFYFSLSHFISI